MTKGKRVIIDDDDHPTPAGDGPGATGAIPRNTPGTSITQATSVPQNGPRYKTRSIVFTAYNLDKLNELREYAQNETEYTRFGIETCPTTGRKHIQGWLQWTNPRSVQPFWTRFDHPHVEPRHGSTTDNNRYTAKEGEWEEYGTPPRQGDRIDWRQAVEQVRAHVPVVQVIAEQPHLLPSIRALERYQTLSRQPPKDRDVRVLYIHGPAGCGKTRAIHQAYPDAYWKPEGQWWDGYEGQPVVVLDDYYSDLPYATALRVLDRYPLRLPNKGGFAPAEYTTVLITSNAHLDEQYPNILGTRRDALYRRIHRVIQGQEGMTGKDITDVHQAPPVRPEAPRQKVPHPPVRTPEGTDAA